MLIIFYYFYHFPFALVPSSSFHKKAKICQHKLRLILENVMSLNLVTINVFRLYPKTKGKYVFVIFTLVHQVDTVIVRHSLP